MGVSIKMKKGSSRKEDKALGRAKADYKVAKDAYDKDNMELGKKGMTRHPNTLPDKPTGSSTYRSDKFEKRRMKRNRRQGSALKNAVSAGATPTQYYKSKKKWKNND